MRDVLQQDARDSCCKQGKKHQRRYQQQDQVEQGPCKGYSGKGQGPRHHTIRPLHEPILRWGLGAWA